MRNLLPLLVICLFANGLFAQQGPEGEKFYSIFRYGLRDEKKAQLSFTQFVNEFPGSAFNAAAYFQLGELASRNGDCEGALKYYHNALTISINNPADGMNKSMQHLACQRIAAHYISLHDFCQALDYLDLAMQLYKYRASCGLANQENNLLMKCLYSSCYAGQGFFKKTITELSPYIFNNYYYSDRNYLERILYQSWLKYYSKEEIKAQFKNLEKRIMINDQKVWQVSASIKIFDQEISVQAYESKILDRIKKEEITQLESLVEKIKKSEIYRLAFYQ